MGKDRKTRHHRRISSSSIRVICVVELSASLECADLSALSPKTYQGSGKYFFGFYFIVRGGFFSSSAPVETTSPFGFIALSALVGLFSPQATLKLKDIAETVFAKPGPGEDNKPQGSTTPAPSAKPAPTGASVTPRSGPAATQVVIAGTNFAGATVKFWWCQCVGEFADKYEH